MTALALSRAIDHCLQRGGRVRQSAFTAVHDGLLASGTHCWVSTGPPARRYADQRDWQHPRRRTRTLLRRSYGLRRNFDRSRRWNGCARIGIRSQLVALDAKSWIMTAALGTALFAAFLLGFLIHGTPTNGSRLMSILRRCSSALSSFTCLSARFVRRYPTSCL